MDKVFSVVFGVSWRTSLFGYVGAIAAAIVPIMERGSFRLGDLILPATLAILGRAAKDAGVTGTGK